MKFLPAYDLEYQQNVHLLHIACYWYSADVTHPKNHVEIWLVILFLSRQKFHAKQIFVPSSSMKLGPGHSAFCRFLIPLGYLTRAGFHKELRLSVIAI